MVPPAGLPHDFPVTLFPGMLEAGRPLPLDALDTLILDYPPMDSALFSFFFTL